jgi:PAS domain S-box-containing protein
MSSEPIIDSNAAVDGAEQLKRVLDSLGKSEARFRRVVEAAPEGMVMVDAHGRIELVNRALERLFGYQREELIGEVIELLLPDNVHHLHRGHRQGFMRAPQERPMSRRDGLMGRRKDGSQFPVEVALNPLGEGESGEVLATVLDITHRKADEAARERALAEKTALLQEVHHRVKNNLQVISSLLNLQSRASEPSARAVLAESQHRVQAMALIHQLLYERNDFSGVEIGLYLGRLCELIRASNGRASVALVVTLQPVQASDEVLMLDLQRAVPCGLLINELVSNAYKHAFPDGRAGCIEVSLTRDGGGAACIRVQDDGVGIPPGVVLGETASLGFQLAPLLVDQLGGTLALPRGDGACFEIRFDTRSPSSP